MYSRSKFLQKTCPTYFDKVKYFTGRAFCYKEEKPSQSSGNHAAVCLLYSRMDDGDLLKLAKHFNMSETAYISGIESDLLEPKGDIFLSENRFRLRWFTPTVEVPLCGHATVVSAKALYEYGNKHTEFEFETQSGDLIATIDSEGNVSLDFPSNFPRQLFTQDSRAGVRFDPDIMVTIEDEQFQLYNDIATKTLPYHQYNNRELWYSPQTKKLVVYLPDAGEENLRKLDPDFSVLLASHDGSLVKGVIVTCLDKHGSFDFFSRYFAPWNGINEDPVTGSAHTVIGPMYAIKLKKLELRANQVSKTGGEMQIKLKDYSSFNATRIQLTGKACCDENGYL
uniref:Phenazine biosynthesis-like domain-containing protein n=2 Tax=Aplanochytrium stocchinoi TaxID=215587 RepID=A0A7S3PCP2_9STRA|mmetsp:Transcript_19140/g.24334  ORF Transcript_19140/g.24334 Transcript_19140/m.24334 type:complete len:338 (+) Transcript_19140:261-1274(+)|eukprot:CAMPEP_0204874166 /NCGR_PEP_ID=MMETSP1348-20121228/42624_1 /ASSEMBLY_ACC=CAM_ASM_000700 /TAXON_ID=215587 /ORGANISM="Aplanochytrium stocchinoi, Strain GSBS06" /LENGTH=337 /DNA_ID=CAMNT_0052029873 /DNA_START=179 /DNA_END=1192 /DNA_ORIENTATION=-